eukprot:TRINITY_DN40411_c0_g1_i1.p1 TRINITY_DN40411_c0_g1~~TRINITY_DN40411_c0_g1_i1.p1  ORF type:complete len:582 (-),score=135.40 TRINITY_DN40411_c0_g1_i1:222-1967(-)
MPAQLIFEFNGAKQKAACSGKEEINYITNFDALCLEAEEKMELAANTYDIYDVYGKVECLEDLQRAIRMAHDGECILEMREYRQFTLIKELQVENIAQNARIGRLEVALKAAEDRADAKIEETRKECLAATNAVSRHIQNTIEPTIQGLIKDRSQMRRELTAMQEKLGQINITEIKEITEVARKSNEQVREAVARVDKLDEDLQNEKAMLHADVDRNTNDLSELRRYIEGKIIVLTESDADCRRDIQLIDERLGCAQDDVRLGSEELSRLRNQCAGALEESEELRDLMGQMREDNHHIKVACSLVTSRVNCLEGGGVEKWDGVVPGVLYFRKWHRSGIGSDVRLSPDHSIAVGRGFLAATGVVIGSDQGLALADGPARRFGTPGTWSSYFELEVDEVCTAPAAAGGLYVGMSIQSAEEVAAHPNKEFDGWLMGGYKKALVCRAGCEHMGTIDEEDLPIPATFTAGNPSATSIGEVSKQALKMLRASMPPKMKGEVREAGSYWSSTDLRMGDRVGVLFRCNREGGAKLKVSVNGVTRASHDFVEAPPAEAIGFLTPVVRLAGTAKACKILPGLGPPSRMLAD